MKTKTTTKKKSTRMNKKTLILGSPKLLMKNKRSKISLMRRLKMTGILVVITRINKRRMRSNKIMKRVRVKLRMRKMKSGILID